MISKSAAMASGLMLGFGIGGLGIGLVGLLVEYSGIVPVIQLLIWLPLLAILFHFFVKPITGFRFIIDFKFFTVNWVDKNLIRSHIPFGYIVSLIFSITFIPNKP